MVATLNGGSKMSSKPTQQRSDLYSRTGDAIKFRAAWLSLSGVIWCLRFGVQNPVDHDRALDAADLS